jgi:hypothetical protein
MKFFMNSLLAVPTLRLIEKHTQDNPVEMQQGFGAYSGCKDKSELSNSVDFFLSNCSSFRFL